MTLHDTAFWQEKAARLRPETRAFVDGAYCTAQSGRTFSTINPATGQTLAAVSACDAQDVDRAVTSARRAFESGVLTRQSPKERKRIMLRFAKLIEESVEELALLETLDVGKPIGDSLRWDVPNAAACIAYYGEAIDKIYGEVAPGPDDVISLVTGEPLGVVAAGVAKALRAGTVWVNCFDRGSISVPFGGFKASGFGRDKSLHAIDKYTDWKTTIIAI